MRRAIVLALAAFATLAVAGPALAARGAGDTLTVVTLNLWNDQQNWPRRRELILAGLQAIHPDVICLEEVLQHAGLRNQAADLAEALGYRYTFASVDPDSAPKRYGNAILSRHPMLETAWTRLQPLDDYRVAAHMRVDFNGRPVDVFVTHLHHTVEGGAIRAQQIANLLAWVETQRGKGPLVLAGDFNTDPTVPELKPVLARYVDVFATLVPGADTVTTLNPAKGHPNRRIDYVFVPREGKSGPTPLSARRILDQPAADGTWPSDHFGIAAQLLVKR